MPDAEVEHTEPSWVSDAVERKGWTQKRQKLVAISLLYAAIILATVIAFVLTFRPSP